LAVLAAFAAAGADSLELQDIVPKIEHVACPSDRYQPLS
jgi:hypothetical protein